MSNSLQFSGLCPVILFHFSCLLRLMGCVVQSLKVSWWGRKFYYATFLMTNPRIQKKIPQAAYWDFLPTNTHMWTIQQGGDILDYDILFVKLYLQGDPLVKAYLLYFRLRVRKHVFVYSSTGSSPSSLVCPLYLINSAMLF